MPEPSHPSIIQAETVDDGIMITFEGGDDVFFSAEFLHRNRPPKNSLPRLEESPDT